MFGSNKRLFRVLAVNTPRLAPRLAPRLLGLGIVLLLLGNTHFVAATSTLTPSAYRLDETRPAGALGEIRPAGARRSIYPNEWGVAHTAGLAYSIALGQFFLLDKEPHKQTTIVAITPYDALVDRVTVDFAVGNALNVAYDEGGRRLLLLNQQATELAQVKVNEQNRLDPATLQRTSLAHLRLGKIQGMAVDSTGQTLFLLDKTAHQIVKLSLNAAFDFTTAPGSYLDLAPIGAANLRGLALHPATQHLLIGSLVRQAIPITMGV